MTATARPPAALQIGIGLPTLAGNGTRGGLDLGGAARHAERVGLDSVSVADLILGDGTPALEAMVALAAAAQATEHVRLSTVLALPLRPVAWVAAQLQALQHVSGGRVVLGVGVGGLPDTPFWHAVGVPARERGRRTDTALAVLPRLIAGEPTRLEDQGPEVTLAPGALVPPILVGGNSTAAIRRAATYGDGWLPSQLGPGTLAAGVARLRDLAAAGGRPAPTVEVGGLVIVDGAAVRAARAERAAFVRGLPRGHGISPEEAAEMVVASPAEAADRIAAYAEAGADAVAFSPTDIGGEAWLRHCDLAAEARALLD
jgi:alkanesulfonate monooxygenase SsuD/methylene tetrahydromethanopterin reductase-like flavin-dependent oxidoreductase (luciferase family)